MNEVLERLQSLKKTHCNDNFSEEQTIKIEDFAEISSKIEKIVFLLKLCFYWIEFY